MKGVFIFSILFFSLPCYSQYDFSLYSQYSLSFTQNNTSALRDSISIKKDTVKTHSVRTAVLLSIVPGAGQVYNHIGMPKGKKKAFWKVPLIYAGLGASTYYLISNTKKKNDLKEEYNKRLDGALDLDPTYEGYDNAGVLTLYNQHLNWRDISILAVGAVYLLQLVDAGVEAHFVTFDVSEDLSLGFDPVLLDYETAGFRMTLNFR